MLVIALSANKSKQGPYKIIRIVLMTAILLLSCRTFSATIEDFSKHPEFQSIKISPDGKRIAAISSLKGRRTLSFIDLESAKLTYILSFSGKEEVGSYYWVSSDRVMVSMWTTTGMMNQPFNRGEFFAVNYDGERGKNIYGYRSNVRSNSLRSTKANSTYAWGEMVNPLVSDDEHALIKVTPMTKSFDALPKLMKINVFTGRLYEVARSSTRYAYFVTDNDGSPLFVTGINGEYQSELFNYQNNQWVGFKDTFEGEAYPISISDDKKTVYFSATDGTDFDGLYSYDSETQTKKLLYRSKTVDFTRVLETSFGHAYGVRIDQDYPSYVYLDDNATIAQLHKQLRQSFGGNEAVIVSSTRDSSKIIVLSHSDKDPGSFYLFDRNKGQLSFIASRRSWIKPADMAAMEPIRIRASDNETILNGYLTTPKDSKGKNLPMVVMPHGGPHRRDYWEFNSRTQMLAAQGYAVLQVNFRGSSGYGNNFQSSGYEAWGSTIQQDIIDFTRWAVKDGVANKDRICIFGGSFGAYSALQSSTMAPDLYKCAIGVAGVYDLPLLKRDTDTSDLRWGDTYLDKTIGTDPVRLLQHSPVYNVHKLKGPVLVIHGEEDERTPVNQAESLIKALEAKNISYEKWIVPKEGHGFYDEGNRIKANKKIVAFLKEHL